MADGYTAEYGGADISEILIDFGVVVGIAALSFGSILALILIYRGARGKNLLSGK